MVFLLSGGLDSAVVLADHVESESHTQPSRRHPVYALTFDYRQRNREEIKYAAQWVQFLRTRYRYNIHHHVLNIADAMKCMTPSPMVSRQQTVDYDAEIPTSFLPHRQAVFYSLAMMFAASKGEMRIIVGSCLDDAPMPDSTEAFRDAMEETFKAGLPSDQRWAEIRAPFGRKRKVDVIARAHELRIWKHVKECTLSCHDGVEKMHAWGRGCGKCAPCEWRLMALLNYRTRVSGTA